MGLCSLRSFFLTLSRNSQIILALFLEASTTHTIISTFPLALVRLVVPSSDFPSLLFSFLPSHSLLRELRLSPHPTGSIKTTKCCLSIRWYLIRGRLYTGLPTLSLSLKRSLSPHLLPSPSRTDGTFYPFIGESPYSWTARSAS